MLALVVEFRIHPGHVADFAAAIGFDPRYGARPLKRAIKHWVIGPLARILAAAAPPRRLRLLATETGVEINIPS